MKNMIIILLVLFPFCFLLAQNAWINEIHYDNVGTDTDEFIEVVIENAASYNLADFTVTLYNGNGGATYGTPLNLSAFTPGSIIDNFSFFSYTYTGTNNIQNGAPDGVTLSYQSILINGQFLSYEGSFVAAGGVANGITSTDIGVSETGSEPVGQSLQLGGSGMSYAAFSWQAAQTATPGAINTGQAFSAPLPEPSNHVTNFTADTLTSNSIRLVWTGSTGAQLPARYLIMAKKSVGVFPTVQDGTPINDDANWADSVAAFNVSHADGKNSYTVRNLQSNTSFDFKIYPYTNAGENINYKTDGDIPTTSATTLITPVLTIVQIQTTANGQQGDSPLKGQTVQTSGIVTAKVSAGYFIQDAPGAWNGIYIYDAANLSKFAPGDQLELTGTVDEYYGMTEIKTISSFSIVSSGNALPAPLVVSTGQFAQEKHEAVLVRVEHTQCTNADLGFGEWEVNDGSGACVVDDWLFPFTPTVGKFYQITGIGNCYTTMKLEPRSANDIVLFTTAPKITYLSVSARVPLQGEDFSPTVQVTDNGALTNVELRYTVNDGQVQSLAMNQAGNDSTFTATIPAGAYNDGDRVEYWVFAQDNDAERSEGEHQGFFAGHTTLSNLRQQDANGAILYGGFFARITGVATIDNGVLDASHLNIYLQDENYSAINLFRYDYAATPLIKGRSYTIVGKLDQYNGLTQLTPDNPETDIIDNGAATLPELLEVNIATLLGGAESLEGLLVKVMNADTVGAAPWPQSGANANLTISDDGGVSRLTLRIDKDTNLDESPAPTWPQNIVGIFTQYDYQSPFLDGYQLLPRSAADLSGINALDEPAALFAPLAIQLYPAYPNPFNPSTTIRFDIPAAMSAKGNIQLDIYNSLGQKVVSLLRGEIHTGQNSAEWNGLSQDGREVASGVYYVVLRANGIQMAGKLLLIR